MKIKKNFNFILAFILIFISFSFLLIIYLNISNINYKGADSEISISIYSPHVDAAFLISPNNPRYIIDDDEEFQKNNVNKIRINKKSILSQFEPFNFSKLNDNEKLLLLDKANELISKKLLSEDEIFEKIVPSFQVILSILYTDSFAKSIINKAYNDEPYSLFYQNFLILRKKYYSIKDTIFELLICYFELFQGNQTAKNSKAKIMKTGDYLIPSNKELRYNHQNAIDIFFKKVKRINKDEIGPQIFSLTPGIVVVSEEGWEGDSSFESYKKGGISPKSGNGVVIFNPYEKQFILYFHLYKTNVKMGQIIKAGDLIGFGGNTGINARKTNHGKHLHLEIYDIKKDRFLNCYELKSILFGK